ncbi:MAG TPA: GTP-binding protein [Methanoregulaceae archaeon]|nr:GTP-binding protein [Methanoregulaceae archaeon]
MAAGKLKIVVFGSYNAGKSTFIQAVDPKARHVESPTENGTTTVGLDFGRIEMRNMQIFLFGTPGQEKFEFVRQIISHGMDAAIIVVDCTSEIDSFTRQLSESLEQENIPLAVMLNKCDMVEACPAMVRRELGQKRIYDISSHEGHSARQALDQFVGNLIKDL